MNENEIFPVDEDDDDVMVTLELDDGHSLPCEILTIFEAGERDYIALIPAKDDADEVDVYLYRYSEDADGTPSLDNIQSDEEYEIVEERFDELLDEAAFEATE